MREDARHVYIETFGCQMNDNDTTRMLAFLRGMNFRPATEPERADLILINTCSIRDKAQGKVYSAVGRYKALKKLNPRLMIGISGCVAQQEGERLLKRLPYVDMVFGPHNIHRVGELVREVSEAGKRVVATEQRDTIDPSEYLPHAPEDGVARAFVSIMRGCDNFCSYCIVPYTRGREVSRPSSDILQEIRSLSSSGVKEITLLGQNVNSYGKGLEEPTGFADLLGMVCRIDAVERVRFVTSHPKDITEGLIMLFGREPKLMRHLHLPVQSGSDKVLERMGRGYTREAYLEKITLLKRLYPDMAITTDIIVGFPGETEDDFRETMGLLETVRFDNIFSFKYSARPMTLAASFPDAPDEETSSRRLQELQELQRGISMERNRSLVGKVMKVLVEREAEANPGEYAGRGPCGRVVHFHGPAGLDRAVVDVLVTEAYQNSLRGRPSMEGGALCC